jgi:POT family proton-dependent oligopeptide transporter
VREQLGKAYQTIQSIAVEAGGVLPSDEAGTAALSAEKDPWGNPLRYRLINASKARISSDGPDKKELTKWDLGVLLEFRASVDELDPGEWLAKRKKEMGIAEEPELDKDASLLKAGYYAGGQTKLEGASYFWFFTGLMLGTAILFIPYAYFYKGKTILQE